MNSSASKRRIMAVRVLERSTITHIGLRCKLVLMYRVKNAGIGGLLVDISKLKDNVI